MTMKTPNEVVIAIVLASLSVVTTAALAQDELGQIGGVVIDGAGQPLADQRVELHSRRTNQRQVTTTDGNGRFAYTGLPYGRYEVEWYIRGQVVVESAQMELSELRTEIRDVILALPRAKDFIDRLGVGEKARVNVELRDGTKVRGYIRAADEESFTVTDSNGFRTRTVAYRDVLKVSKGRSELAKLLIFVGASMGIGVAVIAIAVAAAGGV
jgi:small nuclear ribonucleoprotein (snRNP)-like protein